jgi:CheY-like chemotaxis protein
MQPALCPQSVHSGRATEHFVGHMAHLSALLIAGRNEHHGHLNSLPGASSHNVLVLSGTIMPHLDGVSAALRLRRFRHTPVIAMASSHGSDHYAMYSEPRVVSD